MPTFLPMPDEYEDALSGLTDEDRKRFLESYAPPLVNTGPMTRGVQGFAPLSGAVAPRALMPDRAPLSPAGAAPSGVDSDLMARFAAAQQRGAGNASFASLGARLDNFGRVYAGLPERNADDSAALRQRPVADLMAAEGVKQQQRNQTRQAELDTVNLAKTRAETAKAEAGARATEADEKREAALSDPKSPESAALRATASELLKGRVTPETLASMSGVQIRDALKFGTSQINAEALAGYRSEEAERQQANADRDAKLRAWALQQGFDISKATLEQRERLTQYEAALRAQETETKRGDRTQDQESKLRTELIGLPQVKEYQLAAIGLDKVRSAAKDPSAAGDLALVFGLMKTLDPTSTVREGEFANAQNATGVPERIRNMWNRTMTGERLAPEQRTEFVATAESQFGAYKRRAEPLISGYRKLALDQGLDPSRIILDGLVVGDEAPTSAAPPNVLSSTQPRGRPPSAPMPSGELGESPPAGAQPKGEVRVIAIRGMKAGDLKKAIQEGETIRVKETGKTYKKANGKLIPLDAKE